ncbi:transcriptional regulator [Streptomyces sp. NBC_01261]|uniref:transcriptional regulator n=1 Tax=Streptomyces sp. NBC_01261 TaxID=2903802 RepID=UPI002E329BE9|nr:transcriptional regulator [Streptomyces sp. NBC_01261]
MLRIHFTPLDLQNIRIARHPDPLWELVCAVCRMATQQGPLEFGAWRGGVHERVGQDPEAHRALLMLSTLVPPAGYIPDFLTPSVSQGGLSAALDEVGTTPRGRMRHELGRLAAARGLPSWATALVRPGGRSMPALVSALEVSSRALLEPHWAHIRRAVDDEVGLPSGVLLDGGVRALLESLRPLARWKPPVLEVDFPVDQVLRLEGRGLRLIPSSAGAGPPSSPIPPWTRSWSTRSPHAPWTRPRCEATG